MRRAYRVLGLWIKRHRTAFSVASTLLVLCVILPGTIILFPDSNVWLGVLIVVLSLLDEIKDLADQIEDDMEDSA